ncbi:MAG TPA: DUF948 domain-containing protein [Propionibacteriaceae bacterium]|nr:DUF948 domain-containing protein [Propionibacteriaceae bacterium]
MTGGEVAALIGAIAGLIAALALLIGAVWLAMLLGRLSGSVKELTATVREINTGVTDTMPEVKRLVVSVNDELEKVGVVTDDVAKLSGHASAVANDASQLSSLVTSTVATPLVKLSAFSYGVRRAVNSVRKKR